MNDGSDRLTNIVPPEENCWLLQKSHRPVLLRAGKLSNRGMILLRSSLPITNHRSRWFIRLLNCLIADLSSVRDDAALEQVIVQIESKRLLLFVPKMLNESGKIVGIHLAGVRSDASR